MNKYEYKLITFNAFSYHETAIEKDINKFINENLGYRIHSIVERPNQWLRILFEKITV